MSAAVPVIAIDGPAASGKGTIAAGVAAALGFHLLDSGALYRLVAYKALEAGIELDAETPLAGAARGLDIAFSGGAIALEGREVTDAIRSEKVSAAASAVAVHAAVRVALLERQRAFRRPPGLVADGRDMGTVIFPEAVLKIFLTASAVERAARRHKQLKDKGLDVSLAGLSREIAERDHRDATRAVAPLVPAADAICLDSTQLTPDAVVARVLSLARERLSGG